MPNSPKTGATRPLPVPHKPRGYTGEMSKPGQGPGGTPTPPGVQAFVRGLTRQVKLPRGRR